MIAVTESEWREKRAEEERRQEKALAFTETFCSKLGLKTDKHELIKTRAEKKVRAIWEFLGLAPTDADLTTGTVFKIERDECTIVSAFLSTNEGLIACVDICHTDDYQPTYDGTIRESSEFSRWRWDKIYQHHKPQEAIDREERWKREREERAARVAEWQKKNNEERSAEYRELEAQVKHSSIPAPIVDQLVTLAVNETNDQRESSPDRRPTFAPPIAFSDELNAALERFKALDPKLAFEPGYGRLWAVWESPKRAHGKCKGFALRAGKARDGELITQIRPGSPKWWTGPEWPMPGLYLKEWMGSEEVAKDKYEKQKERFILRCDLRELGIAEILRFAGAPEEVMRAGARFAKICCRCGRELTDPTSMALGIGPECIKRVIRSQAHYEGWSQERTEKYFLEREDALEASIHRTAEVK